MSAEAVRLSPENYLSLGVLAVAYAGIASTHRKGLVALIPPGSENRA